MFASKWILKAAAQFPKLSLFSDLPVILTLSKRTHPSDPHQACQPVTPAHLPPGGSPHLGWGWGGNWAWGSLLTWTLAQDLKLHQQKEAGGTETTESQNFLNLKTVQLAFFKNLLSF